MLCESLKNAAAIFFRYPLLVRKKFKPPLVLFSLFARLLVEQHLQQTFGKDWYNGTAN